MKRETPAKGDPLEPTWTKKDRFRFDKALRLMRKHDPQLQEDGYGLLLVHAADCHAELVLALRDPKNDDLCGSLLSLLATAPREEDLPLFVQALRGADEPHFRQELARITGEQPRS